MVAVRQKCHESFVQIPLALPHLQIVVVVTEGILELLRGQVQGPEGEHEDEREDGRPGATRAPAAEDVRCQACQQHQQDPRRSSVRERQLYPDQAQRFRVGVHPVAQLLEHHGEERRWDVQDATLHVFHDQLLNPVFHERGSMGVKHEARKRRWIERRHIQQLVLECTLLPHDAEVVVRERLINLQTLEFPKNQGVQQAAQPHGHVFELHDFLGVGIGIPTEGSESGSSLEPIGGHVMYRATALPLSQCPPPAEPSSIGPWQTSCKSTTL